MNAQPGSADVQGDDDEDVAPTRAATSPTAAGLAVVGDALVRMGVWTGRTVQSMYTAVDPSLRQHIAETSALGLTFVAGAATPGLAFDGEDRHVVVFVHGLGGHRGNFVPMQRYFAYRGRRASVSVGFDDKSSIEAMAAQLTAVLREIVARNSLPDAGAIDLVAHSMGGIVCRTALLEPDVARSVRRFVTIATPHAGTELARFLDTTKLKSLRPRSELLQKLEAQLPWSRATGLPELVCLWSRQDLVVIPPQSACVAGARAIERSECTHNGFLIRPSAIRAVYDAVASDEELVTS